MKITSARFVGCAVNLEDCPVSSLPEFAFVGRSNVGKSSLINLLAESKGLAKTSGKPGKTRMINFFRINEAWTLVDLPGYGFAKVSKEAQHEFNVSVSAFLNGRENLKHVFALVDSELEPLDGDLAFIEWMQQCKIPYSVIFTKTDRSSDSKVDNNMQKFHRALDELELKPTKVFYCSAKTKRGRGPIVQWIEGQLPKKKKAKKNVKPIQLGWMKK